MKFACAVTLLMGLTAVPCQAEPVALELVLAVDTSESVDAAEFALQTVGLAVAFRAPEVVGAIERAPGGVAVCLFQWGNAGQHAVAVRWRHLKTAGDVAALADELVRMPRLIVGTGTAIADAMRFAGSLFVENGFEGARRVVDVSGDGVDNRGGDVRRARDRLVEAGMTVNGLAIENEHPNLNLYYQETVMGGEGAFVMRARTYRDFAHAMALKLLREIGEPMLSQSGPDAPIVPPG